MQSVYFGGGTPSYLAEEELAAVFETLSSHFTLADSCEITMEANPEDVTERWPDHMKKLGVTRISLGVQSLNRNTLNAVRRNHTPEMARQAMEWISDFRDGWSVDLMLGLPDQNKGNIEQDLLELLSFSPDHLSVYLLERDLPTPLDKFTGSLPDEDNQADFFEQVVSKLGEKGYEHYEISNFCRPGFQSEHNMNYWQFGDYLGVGPAAHGRLGRTYWKNHPNLSQYMSSVGENATGLCHEENWSHEQWNRERNIQGMRLLRGIPSSWLSPTEIEGLESLGEHGLVSYEKNNWRLTEKGVLLANEVFLVFLADRE